MGMFRQGHTTQHTVLVRAIPDTTMTREDKTQQHGTRSAPNSGRSTTAKSRKKSSSSSSAVLWVANTPVTRCGTGGGLSSCESSSSSSALWDVNTPVTRGSVGGGGSCCGNGGGGSPLGGGGGVDPAGIFKLASG